MDTRVKIIDAQRAAALAQELRASGTSLKLITGHFDVLIAEHVRRLREIRNGSGAVFVVIIEPPAPVLAARARAELVAALAMVDYVVPAGEQAVGELLAQFRASEIVQEETADLLRARRLAEHVQSRHKQ
jgi:bifunctional ADP-heptose synthase (sugar kinase/adenylyltransferase)